MFYRMPPEIHDRLFKMGGYRKQDQTIMLDTLREAGFMIRRPALEIMDCLERTDYSRPVNRYVIYGKVGIGKTFTLHHVMHYAYNKGYLMVHCNSGSQWVLMGYNKETAPSESRPGRLDTPVDAVVWLQRFRSQNALLLPKLNLKTSQKYTWSLREATEAGEPLTNIIDHGISRIKHASDCMAVILKELKGHASEGRCRPLVACDWANALWYRTQYIKHPDGREAAPDDITIVRALKKMFRNDWSNGAVLLVVDNTFPKKFKKPNLPKYLLTEKGFEDLDPFIPIKVAKYGEKEMESCLDYYTERLLLQREESLTESGRAEIKFLSCYNPLDLYKLCSGF
jgi:small subunit ribosomal protein S29